MKTMIMKVIKICFMFFAACFVWYACEEEPIGQQPVDSVPPGPVTDVNVINAAGGAILTYTLPDDEDLLYVKAVYERSGETCENRTSLYKDTLRVEGYGDTQRRNVKVIAVDRSQNESTPVEVTIEPLEPEVVTIGNSLLMEEDFGGVNVFWDNVNRAEISVVLLQESDSLMEYSPIETFYSSTVAGIGRVRDMPDIPGKFGVYVQDHWGNRSETKYYELTPIFETLFERELFSAVRLPDDGPDYPGAWHLEQLWNGVTGADEGYSSMAGTGRWPQSITIDMGILGKITRIRIFQRMGSYVFGGGNIRRFEVWGCENLDPSGKWDNWTKLMDCESIKPSGLPSGDNTQEDIEVAQNGEDFINSPLNPKVRYIRIKVTEAWLPGDNFQSCEIQVYGDNR
jgi:hypothetical protein